MMAVRLCSFIALLSKCCRPFISFNLTYVIGTQDKGGVAIEHRERVRGSVFLLQGF